LLAAITWLIFHNILDQLYISIFTVL